MNWFEVLEHHASRTPGFKVPEVFLLDALPRNPSGKVLARELRRRP